MKRDMEVIRKILINIEDDAYLSGASVHLEGVTYETCAYHVALILDAGLAVGEVSSSQGRPSAGRISRLTSAGHDFCDGIRQDTIWNRAKEHILKPGASYGLSVLVEYVKVQVRQQVFGEPAS